MIDLLTHLKSALKVMERSHHTEVMFSYQTLNSCKLYYIPLPNPLISIRQPTLTQLHWSAQVCSLLLAPNRALKVFHFQSPLNNLQYCSLSLTFIIMFKAAHSHSTVLECSRLVTLPPLYSSVQVCSISCTFTRYFRACHSHSPPEIL